ncbi:MAG: glycosyltransferase [Muribaculaceae bacterium]|nr:glycosyltransferase [Muribaculaceae bacterium]
MELISIIVPVYNRPDEVAELLESLKAQTDKDFEIVIVEDGSTVPCLEAETLPDGALNVVGYDSLRLKYFRKPNEGRSIARNYGMERASGQWFIFVDSDVILPPDYIASVRKSLRENPVDCFGGPDAAHDSFTPVQKAINYAMTSFLTTGGIRGGKVSMEKFTPRTFNMGFSRAVYDKVGGFREMFSEDIDMSTRIRMAGFKIALFPDAYVYHKRRGNLRKFWKQVHVFGMSRITLQLLYPGSMKLVHWMPAVFTIGAIALVIASCFNIWFLLPLVLYIVALWIGALIAERNLKIACLAVAASMVQLLGYGTGFIKAYTTKILLGRGRNLQQEIEIRKGKNEKL